MEKKSSKTLRSSVTGQKSPKHTSNCDRLPGEKGRKKTARKKRR